MNRFIRDVSEVQHAQYVDDLVLERNDATKENSESDSEQNESDDATSSGNDSTSDSQDGGHKLSKDVETDDVAYNPEGFSHANGTFVRPIRQHQVTNKQKKKTRRASLTKDKSMSGFSLKQFPSGLDPSTRRNEWSLWRERLMILISLKPSIKSQKDKKGFLVLVGGPEIQKALRGQAVSGEVTNAHPIPEFDNAILRLDNHFNSGTHQMTDIIRFTNLRQKPEEQFIDFVHRLQQYASVCDFKGSEESQILLEIRKGAIHSKKLSKMITREQKTLAEVINYGSTLDNEASFETTNPKKAEDVPGSSYSENADISYVSRPPFRGRNSYPFVNRYTPFQENYRGRGRGRARGRG